MVMKRIMDFVLASLALIVLWPAFLGLALIIKIDSKGPVFFKQKRYGKGKKYFYILKFRTMRTDTPEDIPTHMLIDAQKFITRSGMFLRKTSLDELPQIINILKGEISIVGPRPALWNQDDLITERDKYGANDIPVGLTGLAQVKGRDQLLIEEKAKLDGEYANKIGFWMDVRVLFLTIGCVIRKAGVKEGA